MKLKLLFKTKGKSLRLADKTRRIFSLDDEYIDINGNPVVVEESFKPCWIEEKGKEEHYNDNDEDEDERRFHSEFIEYEGLDIPLISKNTSELEVEVDDVFRNYGFINREGEFVIEPQYAYVYEFTCGLAAVNLNRTWYRSEEGHRYYENHFGYINSRGETVIPFMYDEAYPFNKYGIAVVSYKDGRDFLIDIQGNTIPGIENLNFEHYYDYNERFLEFTSADEEDSDFAESGIFDTKERKILLDPSIDSFIEWDEDFIQVYIRDGEMGESDFHVYYINSKGEYLFPGLMGKDFAQVKRPNKDGIAIVSISKYIELTGEPSSYFSIKGKKYKREFLYGLCTTDGTILLPTEYSGLSEIDDNIFACWNDGEISVYGIEDINH